MQKGPVRKQRFFTVRELRVSLAMIILLSFLSAVAFMYIVKLFGESMKEHTLVAFLLVMSGYAVVVGLLTAVFTHRFIGPFERLRYEIGVILGGNFKRRLKVRRHDDAYLRAFVEDINRVLELLEENDSRGAEIQRDIYMELSSIINKLDATDPAVARHKKELSQLRDRISAHLK